jgi:hypothetical protein
MFIAEPPLNKTRESRRHMSDPEQVFKGLNCRAVLRNPGQFREAMNQALIGSEGACG